MSDYGVLTEGGAVRFERRFDASIDRVWAHLTEPSLRARWLAAGAIDLRPGGVVDMEFDQGALAGDGENAFAEGAAAGTSRFEGRVLQVRAPTLLVHSWTEEDGSESEVTYELERSGEQTLMILTHRRVFDPRLMNDVAAGWHAHLALLCDLLAARPPRPFWPMHAMLKADYEQRLA